MTEPTLFGAFNARQLTLAEVGARFIVPAQYDEICQLDHALLSGPRGSGKTTLLKMLTLPAQRAWASARGKHTADQLPFVGVYIPSDVLWTSQVEDLRADIRLHDARAQELSRAAVAANAAYAFVDSCEAVAATHDSERETTFSRIAGEHLQLQDVFPSFDGLRIALRARLSAIRGFSRRLATLPEEASDVVEMPDYIYQDPIDTLSLLADIAQSQLPLPAQQRWALCFDELEISPPWLWDYLLRNLRSVNQRFVFKLSASPLSAGAPATFSPKGPQEQQDFRVVKLWYSGSTEARKFCTQLARAVLCRELGADVDPTVALGQSPFAEERTKHGGVSYTQRSAFWRNLRAAAYSDSTLRELLNKHKVDLKSPEISDQRQRDQFLRKIKPVVLVRREFRVVTNATEGRRRPRKRSNLYSGADALYAISEGNPRWLNGMLSDMAREAKHSTKGRITREIQSRVVSRTSDRYRALLGMLPRSVRGMGDSSVSLIQLVNKVGRFFENRMLRGSFPLDPVGSFIVGSGTSDDYLDLIKLGAAQGAFIHVDDEWKATALTPRGIRLRLSFLLAPHFHLPLRLYDPVALSSILSPSGERHTAKPYEGPAAPQSGGEPSLFDGLEQ